MEVSFYNFEKLLGPEDKREIQSRIEAIINEGSFIEGNYNKEFENLFSKQQQVKHTLLVANGTDALEIALLAYGVQPGDKVGVPGITFYATAEAVLNIGATPVLIDVTKKDGLIDPESFERVHQKHSLKAVMPVHIYGNTAPMEDIYEFANKNNIFVIEDAAQAYGASYRDGSPIGSLGGLTTFSFYPTKNLSAFGDAGCILTQDDGLAEKIKVIRNHGRGDDNALGRNSRCDHIQAAVLHAKVYSTNRNNITRKEIAKKYYELLNPSAVTFLDNQALAQSAWHLFPLFLENQMEREALANYLREQGISSAPFYERALSQEPPLSKLEGERENAELLAGSTLCLPMHPFLTDQQIQYVSEKVNAFFASRIS